MGTPRNRRTALTTLALAAVLGAAIGCSSESPPAAPAPSATPATPAIAKVNPACGTPEAPLLKIDVPEGLPEVQVPLPEGWTTGGPTSDNPPKSLRAVLHDPGTTGTRVQVLIGEAAPNYDFEATITSLQNYYAQKGTPISDESRGKTCGMDMFAFTVSETTGATALQTSQHTVVLPAAANGNVPSVTLSMDAPTPVSATARAAFDVMLTGLQITPAG
ncbi:hypothetical protein MUG78_09975 [Gordonia alkaliphila]|uniref:hypothetical protein n=1 Tax=Gordonia alkaliphila TaxID=1053547 RepID=UPI001FF2D53B|nr:hypothetical protein [Gordonia alkaliphila]MCK0439776.1 hypothetical protein [Gordonia alkaliphila]